MARPLTIDDVLATGGTAAAAVILLEQAGANVVCAQFLIELGVLKGRQNVPSTRVVSLLEY